MRNKPVLQRARAAQEVEDAIDHYLTEGSADAALGFIGALEAAYGRLARHPASGSPRHGHELAIPGLRSTPLKRCPHLVFYVEQPDHVDVWRVLHGERDVAAWLRTEP